MVGLQDIPCVGVALNRISEATVEAAIRGLRYMLCYKSLMNDLNSKIEKVNIQEERVARKIVEAKDDGKIIENHVVTWQGNVENVKSQADELIRHTTSSTCFKVVHIPNPVSRFRVGRKAAHLAKTVTEHTDYGRELLANEIAHYAPVENVPNPDTLYQSFGSRQEAYEKLWNALVNNDGYPIIGIYGMPGVGKTRMMEKAWEELNDKKIFDKVTRANVGGEKLDVIKLQDQLSGYLNCHLQPSNNEVQRASQLKSSLMTEGQKVLVIVDDVWDVIPLNKIGIPFGDGSFKGCKILLTSRKRDVCLGNKCTDPIEIKPLTNDEAWEMFRKTVGAPKIESMEDPSLAEKVCKECGALPLLIDAVGRALKHSTEDFWKDALYQLGNCELQEIDRIDTKVYACLKLSFEKLKKGEKACLLLCSFFPEDAEIDINMLFDMATASQLLGSGRNIRGLVDSLKSSCLLLEGEVVDSVKVHDVIRDVARSIAARDPDYAFLSVRCKSWLPDNVEYHTKRLLQIDLEGEFVGFPDDLDCPDLHTLWVQSNTHSQQLCSGFFNAFVNLKVVVLEGKFVFNQQLSIHNLKKLRMLLLDDCKINETFLSSVSRNLEILMIGECDLCGPLDLPELKNLRKLDILKYSEIEIVEKGISRLTSLEELIVPYGFKTRGDEEDDKSICWEVSQLGCLRNLVICLKKLWWYNIPDSLHEFSINVGGDGLGYNRMVKRKYLRFEDIYIARLAIGLVERAQQLKLVRVTGLKYVCSSKCLLHLRKLKVENCKDIEEIIRVEDTSSTDLILLPNLQKLILADLPTLTSFCDSKMKIKFPNIMKLGIMNVNTSSDWLEEIELGGDDSSSSKLRSLTIMSYERTQLLPSQWKLQLQNLENLRLGNCWWAGHNSLFNGSLTFHTLKVLEVYNNPVISTLFTTSVFINLHQLQDLTVSDCSLLKEIVEEEDDHKTPISLLQLTQLTLSNLPNLQNIGISACYMPALDNVEITRCGQITSLFTRSALRNLQNLWKLNVSNCSLLREIVEEEDDARDDDGTDDHKTPISLLHLKEVVLSNLPNLQNIGISACYMPSLYRVDVNGCGLITSLFTLSAFTNLRELWWLEVSRCNLLKEIVEDELDDATPGTSDKMISLPQLTVIKLVNLPRLRSFSSSSTFTFDIPALHHLSPSNCPPEWRYSHPVTAPLVKSFSDNNKETIDESEGKEEDEEEEQDDEKVTGQAT